MKKLLTLFIAIVLVIFVGRVEAQEILVDDIPNNSYVIGKSLYTRTPNSDYNYTGALTTQNIMMAAKGINSDSLDDMIIYHKTFLGQWINGLTGEEITPPSYFDIEYRNLRGRIDGVELDCDFATYGTTVNCFTSFKDYSNSSVPSYGWYMVNGDSHLPYDEFNGGVEYYLIRTTTNELATEQVFYNHVTQKFVGIQSGNNYNADLMNLYNYNFDSTAFYQIVARVYYLDGEERIYSDYSNIYDNGIKAKFNFDEDNLIFIDSVVNTDYYLEMSSNMGASIISGGETGYEVYIYNVKFHLNASSIADTDYYVKNFEVYSPSEAFDSLYDNGYDTYRNYIRSLSKNEGSLVITYLEDTLKDKYRDKHKIIGFGDNQEGYLIANAYMNPEWYFSSVDYVDYIQGLGGGPFLGAADYDATSKRVYFSNSENPQIIAKYLLCNKTSEECYIGKAKYNSSHELAHVG